MNNRIFDVKLIGNACTHGRPTCLRVYLAGYALQVAITGRWYRGVRCRFIGFGLWAGPTPIILASF